MSVLGRFSGTALAWLFALVIVALTVVYIVKGTVPDFLQAIGLVMGGGAAGAHVPTNSNAVPSPTPVYVPPTTAPQAVTAQGEA